MTLLYCSISIWKTWRQFIHVNETADEEGGKTGNSVVKINMDRVSHNTFHLISFLLRIFLMSLFLPSFKCFVTITRWSFFFFLNRKTTTKSRCIGPSCDDFGHWYITEKPVPCKRTVQLCTRASVPAKSLQLSLNSYWPSRNMFIKWHMKGLTCFTVNIEIYLKGISKIGPANSKEFLFSNFTTY